MTKIKVGIISYGLERLITGTRRYTVELVRELLKFSDAIEIYLLMAGDAGLLDNEQHLRYVNLPGSRHYPTLVTFGNHAIRKLASKLKLDILHDPNGLAPILFCQHPLKTIVTIHDVFPLSFPGTNTVPETLVYKHWLPKVAPKANAIITDSNHSKKDIVKFLRIPESKVHVIYLGVGKEFTPLAKEQHQKIYQKYRLPQEYVLHVGEINKRKNIEVIIDSMKKLWNDGASYPLVLAGSNQDKFEKIIGNYEETIKKRVICLGYVIEKDLPGIYSGATIFVISSLYEGFGLPPLEAMACGTPAICSNRTPIPEIVGNNVLLFDPLKPDDLSEKIKEMMLNPDMRNYYRNKGFVRARLLSWEKTARNTLSLYQKVIQRD